MYTCKILRLLPVLCLLAVMPARAQDSIAAPVTFREDTLFSFLSAPHNLSLRERAVLVTDRIRTIYEEPDFSADSILLQHDSLASRITYRGQVIATITDADASFSDLDRKALAQNYLLVIQEKLDTLSSFTGIKHILTFTAEALAVIAGLILIIWLLNRLFKRIRSRYARKNYKPFVAGGYTLLTADRVRSVMLKVLGIIRILLILIIIYFTLPILFSIFPWTERLADKLLAYVLNPLKSILKGILDYVPNLLTILVIYLFTRYIIKGVKFMAGEIERGVLKIKGFYPDWAQPTYKIAKALLYIFMFVAIYPYLPGSGSGVFQGVTVFLGLLVSLGSSSAIANMVAGVVITYMRPFRIGERIQVGDVTGDVVEKTLLVTRLRTIKNEDITIPNAVILSGRTINYSTCSEDRGLILHAAITIGYDTPWRKVHELLLNAAAKTEGLLQDPKPFVLQTALGDFYVNYELNVYTHNAAQMAVLYSHLYENILDSFHDQGYEIMSPSFHAIRQNTEPAVPGGKPEPPAFK
ncbi:mechanosensitive ion channel family protein [Chitinophaga barathri]|uniref:Mechanosensitive ion channel family protein n=1 Tax=Chitinophaga barathri TaxID=1647451 RepID=A0A3N4MNA8_9BACT|nr:mechanosensitive ion channel family protein [Chitinophaga barathri]RPD41109.1 mechanosensitive ion channel family protein [Chitinophaga barathri]